MYMDKYRKPPIIWHNMGGHNPVAGIGSDFDLHDILKPYLSPALPRTGNGQEYWQVKFECVTFESLTHTNFTA